MVDPTSPPFTTRNPPLGVTVTPLRRTLGYGPASISTLSPATVTFAAIGLRPGKVSVQPVVPDVAVRTYVVAEVSAPLVGTERTFHLPATSARLTGAGAGAVVVLAVVLALEEAVVSIAAFSFLAQAARTAALQHSAMRVVRCSVNMEPSVWGEGRVSRGAAPSRANVSLQPRRCKR